MGFSDFTTTAAGQEMIAEAVTAGRLKLTKIQLGSGRITSQALAGMAELIEPVLDVAIASKEVKRGIAKDGSAANYALIQGHYKTTQLEKGFYFREIGVFARIDDGEERLFLYNNAYDLADYIDNTVKETQDRTLVIPVFIGSVKEVELELSIDLTYVTNEEFREHEEDILAHLPPGGKEGQILTKGKTKAEWKDFETFPDFDNLLMWPGCIRATPPKDGDTWVERIVTKADRLLRAERITVRVGESEYTETYRFYYEDGVTLKESYIVHTKQEEDGTWYEDITREGGDEPPGDTEPDEPVKPDEPTEPEEPAEPAETLELELSDYEEGVDLYAQIDDELHTVANAQKNTATIDEEYMVFRIN